MLPYKPAPKTTEGRLASLEQRPGTPPPQIGACRARQKRIDRLGPRPDGIGTKGE